MGLMGIFIERELDKKFVTESGSVLRDSKDGLWKCEQVLNCMFSRCRRNIVIGYYNFYLKDGKIKRGLQIALPKK